MDDAARAWAIGEDGRELHKVRLEISLLQPKRCALAVMAFAAAVCSASPAVGQNVSTGEVSVGYQFARLSRANYTGERRAEDYPKGWYADVRINVAKMFAVVGQGGVSQNSHSPSYTFNVYSFFGGVRVSAGGHSHLVPFIHALIGTVYRQGNDWGETTGAMQLGEA